MEQTLEADVRYVPRIGPAMAARLKRLGILKVRDLLYYAPFRYNDYSVITPVAHARVGETITLRGTVVSIRNIFTKTGKRIQEAKVQDGSGILTVIWFNQIYLVKVIRPGEGIALSGKIGWFGHSVVMESPEYELVNPSQESLHTGRLVPVYSETEGVSSKWLRGRIHFLLGSVLPNLTDFLPPDIRLRYHLMPLRDALSEIHFPHSVTEADNARKRLAFDELFIMHLTSQMKRHEWETTRIALSIPTDGTLQKEFIQTLPFTLTNDQQKAVTSILEDMSRTIPMNRLLEGDVGSGKTVVSAIAMYAVWKSGYRSVMMAPTQILAEQHYHTIKTLLEPFGIPVRLILGNSKSVKGQGARGKKKNIIHDSLSYNSPAILIGTHALLEKTVEFDKVGLIVIDEQQRFGVRQRSILRAKGSEDIHTPHLLTMTATPIPRTLALTLYGNLDLSVLSEMPKGRQTIKTWVVPAEKRPAAYEWIGKHLGQSNCRAFIVCPFIDESESMQTVRAATKEYEQLRTQVFPDTAIGLLHGKLKAKDKTRVLEDFRNGVTKILVSTPVVEVGIDIAEATMIIIEAAERFGLSQLHQLRGRVGRDTAQSYCLLFSESTDEKTLSRLKVLETVQSGPALSDIDLSIRGQGDIFGTRQHGLPELVLATLSDISSVEKTREAALSVSETDPLLTNHPLLREMVNNSTIPDSNQD